MRNPSAAIPFLVATALAAAARADETPVEDEGSPSGGLALHLGGQSNGPPVLAGGAFHIHWSIAEVEMAVATGMARSWRPTLALRLGVGQETYLYALARTGRYSWTDEGHDYGGTEAGVGAGIRLAARRRFFVGVELAYVQVFGAPDDDRLGFGELRLVLGVRLF